MRLNAVPSRAVIAAVLVCAASVTPRAHAAKNDVPSGAGRTEVDTKGTPIWWQGMLHKDGDVDWYRFDSEEPGMLNLAFEKPAGKEFFCSLFSEGDTRTPIIAVPPGEVGKKFNGYTAVKLGRGTYFLKIWGSPGHFSKKQDEKYQYALTVPMGGGTGGGANQQQPQQEHETPQPQQAQPTPQVTQAPQARQEGQPVPKAGGELTEDQARALIEALEREERDPTHLLQIEGAPAETHADKDW